MHYSWLGVGVVVSAVYACNGTTVERVHPAEAAAAPAVAPQSAQLDQRATALQRALASADTVLVINADDSLNVWRFQDAALVRGRLAVLDDRRNQLVLFDTAGILEHRLVSAQTTTNSLRDLRMIEVRDSSLWLFSGPDVLHEMHVGRRTLAAGQGFELGMEPADACLAKRGVIIHRPSDTLPLTVVSYNGKTRALFGPEYASQNAIVRSTIGETRVACGHGLVLSARAVTGEIFGYDSELAEVFRWRAPEFDPLRLYERSNGAVENRPSPGGFDRIERVGFLDAQTAIVQIGEYSTRIDTLTGLNGRERVRVYLIDTNSGAMSEVREQQTLILAASADGVVEVNRKWPERLTWIKLRQ